MQQALHLEGIPEAPGGPDHSGGEGGEVLIFKTPTVVIPDAESLIEYLEARRDLSLNGEQWEGATAVIEWLQAQIYFIQQS